MEDLENIFKIKLEKIALLDCRNSHSIELRNLIKKFGWQVSGKRILIRLGISL